MNYELFIIKYTLLSWIVSSIKVHAQVLVGLLVLLFHWQHRMWIYYRGKVCSRRKISHHECLLFLPVKKRNVYKNCNAHNVINIQRKRKRVKYDLAKNYRIDWVKKKKKYLKLITWNVLVFYWKLHEDILKEQRYWATAACKIIINFTFSHISTNLTVSSNCFFEEKTRLSISLSILYGIVKVLMWNLCDLFSL